MRRNQASSSLQDKYSAMIGSFDLLGSTEAGRAWNMKALNPSWVGKPQGMPDRTSVSVAMYNYESSETIQMPSGDPTKLWNVYINCFNHPIIFADVWLEDTSKIGVFTFSKTILNSQIPDIPEYPNPGGYSIPENTTVGNEQYVANKIQRTTENLAYKLAQLRAEVQHGRSCYAGVTGTFNANTQNDQGIVHGGQITQCPVNTSIIDLVTSKIIPQYVYDPADYATYKSISNSNRSLKNSPATEGFYGIFRLEEDMERFRNIQAEASFYSEPITFVDGAIHAQLPRQFCMIKNGTKIFEPLSNQIIQVFMQGVASSSQIDLTFRMGFEAKPKERAMNGPFCFDSPRLDPLAMEMYSKINSEISMDLWTAAFNRFEWLGQMIQQAMPYIKAAGHGALANMDNGIMGMLKGGLDGAIRHAKRARTVNLVED